MASIRERVRKDGSITYTVLWRDPDTRKQESYATPEPEIACLIKRLLDENGQDWGSTERLIEQTSASGLTVIEAIREYIQYAAGVTPGTRHRYESYMPNHLIPYFKTRRLAAIEYSDVAAWVRWMSDRGLSPKTISNVHGLLSAAMKTAVRLGHISKSPCEGIKLPKAMEAKEEINFLTHEEYQVFRSGLRESFHPFADFLVGTGLRLGEVTALGAEHFSLDAPTPTVRVSRAWKQGDKRRYYLGPPKSRRSIRTVSLSLDTVAAVRPLVDVAAHRGPGAFVFTMPKGGQIRSGNLYSTIWKPAQTAAKAAGLMKTVGVHDLRHTHASWMIDAGMDIYELSRRLGHESIKTTESIYLHLLPQAHKRGAEIAARALRGPQWVR